MGMNEERLKQIYQKWRTEDLIKAVTVDKANYEPFAIDLMNMEIQKRRVSKEEIANVGKELLEHEAIFSTAGIPFCPYCHSTNVREVRGIWQQLWSLFGLFLLFIPKYECLECGYNFNESKGTR